MVSLSCLLIIAWKVSSRELHVSLFLCKVVPSQELHGKLSLHGSKVKRDFA